LYDEEKTFRINNNIKMKSWIALINPLKYGEFFYGSSSGHIIPIDDSAIILSSIRLALTDYEKLNCE